MSPADYIEVFPHSDEGYGWRKKAGNHEIVATSGSETFENPTDAKVAAIRVFGEDTPIRIFYRKDADGS